MPKLCVRKEETMPTDACQFFYECENCKATLKQKQGDGCVYCSYGTIVCPSNKKIIYAVYDEIPASPSRYIVAQR